jgi:ElaB/YqjD/DUF883 family membrane-anchored ribosome-binding protein
MSIILRVDGLLGNMNGTVYGEQVKAAREKLERSLKKASNELLAAEQALVERTKKAAGATDHYLHDHPWASIGVAGGVGFLLGLLVGRK